MASKTKLAATKKVGQNDLRKLMKQHKASRKIDSPLAKYNALGQLVCVVCQQQVKSEVLWNAHLQSRSHKQNHDVWKSKQHAPQEPVSSQIHAAKRHLEEKGYASALKKSKPDTETVSSRLALANYSSSDEEDETPAKTNQSQPDTQATSRQTPALPSDFFDSNGKQTDKQKTGDKQTDTPTSESSKSKTMADKLPEGFFDDPVEDARARDIVYVDKNEVEWEQFQREMKEQSKVSELLQDEVDEEVQEERDLAEVDEQIQKWSRLNNLQERKEAWSVDPTDAQTADGDSSAGSDDEDVSLDWRAKSCKR